jgi:hypothetical protein
VFCQVAGAGVLATLLTLVNSSVQQQGHVVCLKSYLVTVTEPLYRQMCGDFNLGLPYAVDPTGEVLTAEKTFKFIKVVQSDPATSILAAPAINVAGNEQRSLPLAKLTAGELRIELIPSLGRSGEKELHRRGIALKLFASSETIGGDSDLTWIVTVPDGGTLLLDVGKVVGARSGAANHRFLLITPSEYRPSPGK